MLEADHRLVEPVPAHIPVLGDGRVDVVPNIVGPKERRGTTEIEYVGLVPAVDAEFERLGRREDVGELAEREGRPKGLGELPRVLR